MIKVLIFMLLLLPISVEAGGPAWKVEIISFERNNSKAVFKLKNIDKIHTVYQACNPLTVITEYKGEPWYFLTKTWSKNVSKEDHKKALQMLEEYYKDSKPVMFGYIGTGIVSESNRNVCTVLSRGLTYDANVGFTSFHDPI